MLVLTRKQGERIQIGEGIEVTVLAVRGQRVVLGLQAPLSTSVHRAEIQRRVDAERSAAPLEEVGHRSGAETR